MIKEVNVLGTKYKIDYRTEKEDAMLINYGGYCDWTVPQIVIAKVEKDFDTMENIDKIEKQNLKHEIIHAFLNESGLKSNSEWARNEEMVDWFAIQFDKIKKAFEEVGC